MFGRNAALAFVAAVAITGCKGADGKNGAPGADLRPPMTAETCTYCHAADGIADATPFHDGAATTATAKGSVQILTADFTADGSGFVKPTITFKVLDADGANVADWPAFNFTIAQLVPATPTVPEHWSPFIWGTRTGFANGVPSREIGGAQTSGTPKGTLSYNAGTETYTYVFATDITGTEAALNSQAPVYDPNATFQIGLQITTYSSGTTPSFDMANGVADFEPSVSANATALVREIATTAACNACHGRLTIHGRRVEVNYCATCHLRQLVDDNGNSGDLSKYIHQIHGREKISSPTTAILGGIVPEEITYPQNIIHCDTCHAGTAGQRWNTNPSMYACTSCHDNVSFAATVPAGMTAHTGGACASDQDCGGDACTVCHTSTSLKTKHSVPAETEAAKILPEFGTVTYNATTNTLTAQFRIGNPTVTPVTYYPLTNSYFTQAAGASSLSVLVAFRNTDFTNEGATGTTFGQPLNINLLSLPTGATLSAQDTTTGYYTLTLANALPASAVDTSAAVGGTVAIQGHPAFLVGTTVTRIPMKNVSKNFTINLRTGSTTAPAARRTVVNIDKCNDCHFNLSLHGNNRTGDITTCTTCHNTEATDGSRRPNFTTPGALGTDGKLEEGIDFKYMIHSIHGTALGGAITVYGYGGSVNDFSDVGFPNAPSNCLACHNAGTYQAPATVARGTSTFAGDDRAASTDNLRTTKGLATCGACHASGTMQSHMTQMGGAKDVTQAQIDAVQ